MLAGEVKPVDVAEVPGLRQFLVFDVVCRCVCFLPLLSLFESFFELRVAQVAKSVALHVRVEFNEVLVLDLGKMEGLITAVFASQRVVFGVLTCVCLPPYRGVHVYLSDQKVLLIRWSSFQVQVLTLVRSLLGKLALALGWVRGWCWLGLFKEVNNLSVVSLNDLVELHFTSVKRLAFLKVVMGRLHAVETLDVVLCHRARFVQWLHEPNHGLSTVRIKLIVVAAFNLAKGVETLLLRLDDWVL